MKKYKSWKDGIRYVHRTHNPENYTIHHIKGIDGITWEIKRHIRCSLRGRLSRVWFIMKFLCRHARWPLKRTAFRGLKRIG